MICPFRIKENIYYGTLKEQEFQTCLKYDCPAYRYKQISDVTYKDVCLRLIDSDDKFYKELSDKLYPTCRRKETDFTKEEVEDMFTELQTEIEGIEKPLCHSATYAKGCVDKGKVEGLIQQKIDKLKEDE